MDGEYFNNTKSSNEQDISLYLCSPFSFLSISVRLYPKRSLICFVGIITKHFDAATLKYIEIQLSF